MANSQITTTRQGFTLGWSYISAADDETVSSRTNLPVEKRLRQPEYAFSILESNELPSLVAENVGSIETGTGQETQFSNPWTRGLSGGTSASALSYRIIVRPPGESYTAVEFGVVSNLMRQALQITANLYRDVVEACQKIINELDINDEAERAIATARLADVLTPFDTVLSTVMRGVLDQNREQPLIIGFLLGELMLNLRGLAPDDRIPIISEFITDPRPSLRFVAVRALDNLGEGKAKQTLASAYPHEPNKQIKRLIEASLSGM
jgi:hypothetical protein